MVRHTGPGRSQKLPDGSTLLFNFDIDSSELKTEHRAFLERTILTAANNSPAGLRVVIGGSADRLGDAQYNVALSNRRIDAVAAFLKQRKPGYRWTFVGFGQGVGEATAERAGDRDNTRDDLFRSVIVEVLAPGRPVPPKPNIPKNFPKKPNVFPRPLPRPNPTTCVTEKECPLSQDFSIQLIVGVTGGEIIEAAFFTFLLKDLTNKLVSGAKARAWRDFLLAATRSSSIQAACDRPARDVWPVAWGAAGARGEAAGQGDRA